MVSSTWPDGAPATVNDLQYEILGAQWAGDGLIGSPDDPAAVYADSTGRQIKFRAGKYAHVHGHGWASGSADIVYPIAANGSAYPRIDLAVLGLDRSTVPWRVTEYVKPGTPSAAPVAPALVRDGLGTGTGKWELPLALVTVGSGVTTINPANVTPLSVYVGQQKIMVPDVATLAQIPAPVPGTTASVFTTNGPIDYVYTAGTGWRRADWNAAWGVIGGREYTSDGTLFAGGVGAGESYLQMNTGPIATVAGRRYEVRARFRTWNTASGATHITFIREGSLTGAIRAMDVLSPTTGATSSFQLAYQLSFTGHFSIGASAALDYMLCGYCIGGSMYVARTIYGAESAGISLIDIGPASVLGPVV